MNQKYIDRLMKYVTKTDTCWLWTGETHKGYGRIKIDGKKYRTHRLSYQLYKGEIPKGLVVCHKCDVCNCINPDHLFLGTQKENIQDAIRKGRWGTRGGHGGRKKSHPSLLSYREGCRCAGCMNHGRAYYIKHREKILDGLRIKRMANKLKNKKTFL